MPNTYATWNPSDKNSNITLSNGNLTATQGALDGWDSVRSTIGVSSGKWYWEITVNSASGSGVFSSIANTTAALTSYLGADTNGWGYHAATGNKFNNGDLGAYGATYVAGDVIGVALDMDAGTLIFYKNGTSQGTAFTGLSGTFYAGTSLILNTTDQVTANFGASTFSYSVPSGYNSGLYTSTPDANHNNLLLLGVG